jgi:hypothetical protein
VAFDTDTESYAGDDPSGAGDTGVGYGSTSMDTGGNQTDSSVLSQAGFNQAMGITPTNPYPNSFFSQLFGPENVNYAAIGIDTQGIANLAYNRYTNPLTADGNLREGLSEGEKTVLGDVVSIDRPQGIGETIARTAFGLTPLGPVASFMGKEQLSIAPNDKTGFSGSPNYDPTLDPNSIEYQGPQGFLGQLGKGIESITFGGARPVTETTKGILDLFEGQEAERAMGGYETFDGKEM